MVTYFRGYYVPEMGSRGLESCADAFNARLDNRGWCTAAAEEIDCGDVSCKSCLLGVRCGNSGAKIAAFAAYLRSKGLNPIRPGFDDGRMPVVRPGMAILLTDMATRGYVCEATGDEVVAYKMLPGARHRSPLTLDDLRAIMGVDGYKTTAVAEWTRMKKLTVDEISKLLGYTVEIVGSENADD